MRKELEDLLYERYPDLFIERHKSKYETSMCWGFCCGDGWVDLIDGLCAAISGNVRAGKSPPVVVTQVKEKLGRLRFRFKGGDDEIRRLVCLAEDQSERTCEICGRSGAACISSNRVLCPVCEARESTSPF